MKVFSNKGGGAQDSDIIAAIEDSVKLGADVINMSLGSTNGITDISDGSYRAIEKAREAGVLVVISAGNDGKNFDLKGGLADVQGYYDDGTIGSPAVQGGFAVASVENDHVTQASGFYNDGEDHGFAFSLASGEPDGKNHQIYDAGVGKPNEFPKEAKGNFVLIKRGELTFTDKYKNAQNAGAAGVIVWNHEEGGEEFVGMAGIEEFKFLSASVKNSTGKKILAAINKAKNTNKPVTVRLTENWVSEKNPTALEPSSFTSWGTTPALDFTPDIAGIGGSVYSLQNNNKYATKSGTSMAAPNISGLSALVLQKYKQLYPQLSRVELLNRVQIALSNTATILEKNGIPYSPRQIGAGLAQVDQAIATSVFATVNGKPSAALKEVSGARKVTVDLVNVGKEPAVYSVPAQQVIRETNGVEKSTRTSISGETVTADKQQIQVPAGGKAKITFTIQPDTSKEGFILGWLKLKAAGKQPNLAIPYLGFVGDWNKEQIVAAPGTGLPEKMLPAGMKSPVTALTTSEVSVSSKPLGNAGEKEIGWISPNGDKQLDTVNADLVLLRNAFDARYSIRQGENLIAELGQASDVRRISGLGLSQIQNPAQIKTTAAKFDGKIYDPAQTQFVPVADGIYTYRVETRLSEEFKWQTTDMKFGVDNTAPEITIGDLQDGTVTVKAADCTNPGTGCAGIAEITATNPDGAELDVAENNDGTYSISGADLRDATAVLVTAVDAAQNIAQKSKSLAAAKLTVFNAGKYNNPQFVFGNAATEKFADGVLVLDGVYPEKIKQITVNGKKLSAQEQADGQFSTQLTLQPGPVKIEIVGSDETGEVVDTVKIESVYDNQPPVLNITEIKLDENGYAVPVVSEELGIGFVHVKGTVTDNRKDAKLTVKGLLNDVAVESDGSFEGDFYVMPEAVNLLLLSAFDGGNISEPKGYQLSGYTDAPSTEPNAASLKWDNVECISGYQMCLVSGTKNKDVKKNSDGTKSFTLRGSGGEPGSMVVFTPQPKLNAAGSNYEPLAPINALVKQDGSFAVELPVVTGNNHFAYILKDKYGKTLADAPASFWVDVNLPTLRFDEPKLIGGTLYTNQDEVRFKGTASDDGWGYTLSINNFVPADEFYESGIGAPSNERSFDRKVAVKNGDNILLQAADSLGNGALSVIPVVVDKENPTLKINEEYIDGGVQQKSVGNLAWVAKGEAANFSASVADENIAALTVSVDEKVLGTKYSELKTTSVDGPKKVEETFIDSNELAADDTEAANREADAAEAAADPNTDDAVSEPAADNAAGSGTLTANTDTQLTLAVSVADLEPGTHTFVATGYDLAGNAVSVTRTFFVYAPTKVTVDGEQPFEFEIDRADLNPGGAAKLLLPKLQIDPGTTIDETGAAKPINVTAKIAEDQIVLAGANTLKVLFVDSAGEQAAAPVTVQVNLKLKQNPLESNGVRAAGSFRGDDMLYAEWSEDGDSKLVKISNRPEFKAPINAPETALISIPAAPNWSLWVRNADGSLSKAVADYADGKFVVLGSYNATYVLQPPAKPIIPRPAFTVDTAPNAGRVNPAAIDREGVLSRTGAGLGVTLLIGAAAGIAGAVLRRKGVHGRSE
ncbi:S8 family serine peptidase [Arcanobacterium hippocoleae]